MQKITLHILRTLGSALFLLLPLMGTAQVPGSQAYETFDIDYCQADGSVNYNFYWPGGHVSGSPFFGSNSGAKLTFTEFDDGTALIEGTTVQGTCEAEVYVVLVGLSNWTEWQAKGGSYKEMGCSQPDPTQMRYYEIDDSRSYITVTGGDCIETGTFTVSQRPDPNDPTTPHLGAHIGIGGAGWDTDKTAEGLATWGWIGTQAEPQKWIMDFNFHIEEEPEELSCEVTGTHVDCYGDNDGTASVEVTGGVAPYTYAWSGGITDTDAMVENLAPGVYMVTVTDYEGAETQCAVEITGPDAALECDTEVLSNVSVNGGSDGSAKVSASGGTMPYSYMWDNGETTDTANNLTAGTYEVKVTDANGCETVCKVEIKEPGALSCEVTGTDVDCYGDDDGTASVQVNGGVMPYSYAWDGGITDTDAMVENLAPGMYSVTVTDANGAETKCSVTIKGPDAALECETEVLNDVSDNGGSDGSAKVTASGGTMPYSYMWENGETTQTAVSLSAGTHEVKVTDANGCETICKVEIKEPAALSCEVTGTDVKCFGDDDGTASVQVTGGVMPYSYAWDGGITDTDAMVDNLAPGMYSVTVTDANGAQTECSVTIEGPDATLECETEVVSDVTEQGGADGSAQVTAMGGTMPYSYEWDNGETTQTAVNLMAGIHEVTVTDANGCKTICEVEIDEPTDEPEPGCETAFGRYGPNNVCFLEDGFNRWGWTNFFADEDTYTFESYSGAGQCDLSKGTHSANITVVYANGMATVTIETLPGFYMTEVQLYIGDDKYPTQGNSNTVAPGQYPYKEDGLNNVTTYTFDPIQVGDNGFWMILHSVTCYQNGADRAVTNSKLMQLKPYPTVFDNSLQVAVDATEDTEVNVAVYSTNGVQVLSQKFRLNKGHNEIPLTVPGLNAAMYILEVSTLDGERLTAKLISK